jgi:cell division protein FtsZ
VGFVAMNTDAQSLAASSATEKVHLETQPLRGLGTGGDPDRGRALAEEQLPKLKSLCEGANVVFILAGLGGGAGTGISPVLAGAAKEAGALVLGFVTTPFDCEGGRRQRLAQYGLAELKAAADGVISLPNQKVFKMIDENTSVLETFKITNDLLAAGVRGVWRLLMHKGLIEIHFSDLAALLRDRHGESCFAVAEAMGPTRSREVMDKLLAHPMLDDGQMLGESDAVLVSLMAGPDLTMAEVNRVMEQVNRQCEHAQVIMGAAIDEAFKERLAVTLIAARKSAEPEPLGEAGAAGSGEELAAQLLPQSSTARRGSRFLPPAPTLPADQLQQLLARQGRAGSRPRKSLPKLRQGQLPLEIVSKGRFDKSEPTIHKGEDLDVPTYIRRGVALN